MRIENAISGLFDQAIELYGGLDYLFNNAGIEGVLGPISESSEEIIDDVLSINIGEGMEKGVPHKEGGAGDSVGGGRGGGAPR